MAIEVRDLRKSYGRTEAVRGVDLQVAAGEVFALLGPNGAGKTTTVEIMEGHRMRSSGEVSVLGHDPGKREAAFKQRIGIVLQETGVEPFLSVAEAIELYRGYYTNPRPLDEIIEVVGLKAKRDERVNRLSGGQQRRLDVAIGLAGDPELLFLDEPTTGFDPGARRNAWDMIRNLAALGKTVFLTTHYMDEAESLAGRVAIIVAGQIVAEGSPESLIDRDSAHTKISFGIPPGAPEVPAAILGGRSVQNGRVELETDAPMPLLHALTGWAIERNIELTDLKVSRPTLEDVYLKLTAGAESSDFSPAGGKRKRRKKGAA